MVTIPSLVLSPLKMHFSQKWLCLAFNSTDSQWSEWTINLYDFLIFLWLNLHAQHPKNCCFFYLAGWFWWPNGIIGEKHMNEKAKYNASRGIGKPYSRDVMFLQPWIMVKIQIYIVSEPPTGNLISRIGQVEWELLH